jgi:serine O-acetyltransferase
MILSMPHGQFKAYVLAQLDHFFPDGQHLPPHDFGEAFDRAIERTNHCFLRINLPGYHSQQEARLNHLHANQYAVFLWFLSNTVWTDFHHEPLANKLYCLNRALNGLSCSYEAGLPRVFALLHVVGTVLGKAEYADYFVACHGCTVGAHHGVYPRIGREVAMLPHSSIIGDCRVGNGVSLGANVMVYERHIPDGTTLYLDTETGKLRTRQGKAPWAGHLFRTDI